MYAMLAMMALLFITTVIVLATYVAYIYITIVFAFGLLIILATKRE